MKRKNELTFLEQCWHGIVLALIILIGVQVCCGVLSTILFWDVIKSVLFH